MVGVSANEDGSRLWDAWYFSMRSWHMTMFVRVSASRGMTVASDNNWQPAAACVTMSNTQTAEVTGVLSDLLMFRYAAAAASSGLRTCTT